MNSSTFRLVTLSPSPPLLEFGGSMNNIRRETFRLLLLSSFIEWMGINQKLVGRVEEEISLDTFFYRELRYVHMEDPVE